MALGPSKGTVLVTGAAGYIGGCLAIRLKQQGYKVIGVDKHRTPHIVDAIDLFSQTIASDLVEYLYDQKITHVVHCAASVMVNKSVSAPAEYFDNNVVESHKIINWMLRAAPNAHLIFCSSSSVYGDHRTEVSETSSVNPLSPYAENKLTVEKLMAECSVANGLRYTALRFFNVCGATQYNGQPADAPHLIPSLLRSINSGKRFDLYGTTHNTIDGSCVRDYVHVVDVCRAIEMSIEQAPYGKTYNVGSGIGTSNWQMIRSVERAVGKTIDVVEHDARAGDCPFLVANTTAITNDLGWHPSRSVPELIIDDVIQWTHNDTYR